jgi:hypothetical protein
MPGEDVTFELRIKNEGLTKILPKPTHVFSYETSEGQVDVARAPEAPPYAGLAPGASLYRSHKIKMGCKNRVSVVVLPGSPSATSADAYVEWSQSVDAKPCADFYQACVARINKLRSLEGLSPLARAKDKEACSDDDARTNYAKKQPHASQCGQAQNECWTSGSLEAILDDCLEQYMYHKEKACYIANPSGCYSDPACVCGHYVNMMDKGGSGYASVACGLHETADHQYHAVVNFF